MKLVLFFLIIANIAFSQKISGRVLNKENNPIENANVSLWDSNKKQILLGYNYTNENGFYSIEFKSTITNIYITVSCIDFATSSTNVDLTTLNNKLDFILESKETDLQEVIINEDKAVKVKNDTTFYDPIKFLNGSENKVEDLIKKLPGMTVNEKTGEIKYKGKTIETVKLDGGDLFGGNYSIGTKNIAVDMVEQVQAIEHYFENSLLKGIKQSDLVAINLKLKKQKSDYSGTSSICNGFSNKILFNDDITLLGISKNIKSFGIISYNNFGGGNVDINSFSQGFNSNETPDKEFYATTLIAEPSINSSLDTNRTKFNNSFFSNYNLIYKLSKRLSIKNNIVYYNDNSQAFETFSNQFYNKSSNLSTTQNNNLFKKINSYKANFKLTFNLNKKSMLISSFSFANQLSESNLNSIQSNSTFYKNGFNNNSIFYKTKTDYTLRISDKSVLQCNSEISTNIITQDLQISPNNNFITGDFSSISSQNSRVSRSIVNNTVTYSQNVNNFRQSLLCGIFKETNLLTSRLVENNLTINSFDNDLTYKKTNFYLEYETGFKLHGLVIQPYFNLNFLTQKLFNNLVPKVEKFAFINNFSISFDYKLSKNANISLNISKVSKTPECEYLFLNNILESNNFIKKNIPSLNLVENQNTMLGYKYYNLIKQYGFNLNLQYQIKQNTFLSNITINPNFISTTYFQSPSQIQTKNISLTLEKYIKFLKLYFKQTSSYAINNYKNAIANFELRDNTSNNINVSTLIFSSFDFPINFENKFNYNIGNYFSDAQLINQRITYNNTFKIVINPAGNYIYTISQDYFVTNAQTKTHFNFIDVDIKYKSSKLKGLSFNIIGRNLLNIKEFTETINTDFSTTIYQSNLLPKYFLFSTNFSF